MVFLCFWEGSAVLGSAPMGTGDTDIVFSQ